MAKDDKEEKKLIIDEDWKAEAQKEKEVLKKEEELEHEAEARKDERAPLPDASFSGLVSMITTQAYFALGILRAEGEEERAPDLAVAKYNIDLLEVIDEKTKGNLDEEEHRMLEGTLHQLRMVFVKLTEGG
jgi:hypothetical protein